MVVSAWAGQKLALFLTGKKISQTVLLGEVGNFHIERGRDTLFVQLQIARTISYLLLKQCIWASIQREIYDVNISI